MNTHVAKGTREEPTTASTDAGLDGPRTAAKEVVLGGFARTIIRRKARRVLGCCDGSAEELRDIEQELIARMLRGLKDFDPAKTHINVFITTVVEKSAGMLIRERLAKKRHCPGRQTLNPSAVNDGSADTPDRRDHKREEERLDLARDLAEVLAELPVDLRDLAERLMVNTVSQAARDRKLQRSSLQRHVERLRKCFEDSGLRIYLE